MRCSDCSAEVKPIIAIDIDGVLGDYHSHFLNFLHNYLYIEDWPEEKGWYNGDRKFSYWVSMTYGISIEEYRKIKLAYRQGAMKRTMPIFRGAQALCWVVRDAGAELWLTTTRPYLSLDGVVPDTVAWLAHHDIQYDGLLFDDDKYQVLAERVDKERVVNILDDQIDMLNAAAAIYGFGVPVLVRNPYNSAVHAVLSADLDACVDIVKRDIEVWKVDHAS
jgi:hypothetical protein